jgi:hypothetical protein
VIRKLTTILTLLWTEGMTDDLDEVTCDEHGQAKTTYVCSHLPTDPVQRWHCARACDDNRWPDAWCDQCNEIFLREGEWNDQNSDGIELKILCHHCYERLLGQSVARLRGSALLAWQSFVKECHQELESKQDRLEQEFFIGRHKRWDWDQERAELIFSSDGVPAVIARIEFVGSISSKSDTWLWSWANPGVLNSVKERMATLWQFGEQEDFPHLTVPKWSAEEIDGWEMAAVAAHILDARGVYRTPSDTGFTFLLLTEVRFAQ